MYQAKNVRKLRFTPKRMLLLVSLVLILTVSAAGTTAFLIDRTEVANNRFMPSYVTCAVQEDYRIQNTGNTDAFIRAAVAVTWQDGQKNVWSEIPGYTISYDGWILKSDGYYYWPDPIAPGGFTGVLKASGNTTAPTGYDLVAEYAAEAIQAKGVDTADIPAVTDAWGITVGPDGRLQAGDSAGAGSTQTGGN